MVVRQIVHMDLKSPNVLLPDRNCLVAKIADLGLSRQIAEGSLLTNAGHGVNFSMRLGIGSCRSLPDTCKGNKYWSLISCCGRLYRMSP